MSSLLGCFGAATLAHGAPAFKEESTGAKAGGLSPGKIRAKGPKSMSIFARPHYTSEITNFIEQMKEKKPTLEADQRAGRALLWDKHLDRNALEEYSQANVPQQPYVYQTRVK
jgi:hypothetical protein